MGPWIKLSGTNWCLASTRSWAWVQVSPQNNLHMSMIKCPQNVCLCEKLNTIFCNQEFFFIDAQIKIMWDNKKLICKHCYSVLSRKTDRYLLYFFKSSILKLLNYVKIFKMSYTFCKFRTSHNCVAHLFRTMFQLTFVI